MEQRTMLTTEEVAAKWGVSRALIWSQIHRGEIPSIKVGRRFLIPNWWIKKAEGEDGNNNQL